MDAPGPSVTLVRHGETAWSRSGQHTGRTDLPLTADGERQAEAVGRDLRAAAPFDVVFSSPLQRARRTAELAGLAPYEVVDDLREWDYGALEGRTSADIRTEWPDWTIWDGPWPEGEDRSAVAARCDRVVARLRAEPSSRRVAVVAHGHILRALAARWVGTDIGAGRWLSLATATVSVLGWEHATPVIDTWNRRPAQP